MNLLAYLKIWALPLVFFTFGELPMTTPCLLETHDEIPRDTIIPSKVYRGYRLYITQMKVDKETNDWIRITFTAINTGRKDIDFSRKGSEHWVQILFDDSLRSTKMGGFQENIRFSLYQNNFQIRTGAIKTNQELRFTKTVDWNQLAPPKKEIATVKKQPKVTDEPNNPIFERTDEEVERLKKDCPDLVIANAKVKESNKKYSIISFTLANNGKATGRLSRVEEGEERLVGVLAYLSGVDQMTRGALPIGSFYFNPRKGPKSLRSGAILTESLKLDTRKKTDFLKYIILTLDAYHVDGECDRTNNTKAILLE